MDNEALNEKPDMALGYLAKQDLYDLSVTDLEDRICALKSEISRCEKALSDRGSSKSEADKLFKP